jgi:hypothetical protein
MKKRLTVEIEVEAYRECCDWRSCQLFYQHRCMATGENLEASWETVHGQKEMLYKRTEFCLRNGEEASNE